MRRMKAKTTEGGAMGEDFQREKGTEVQRKTKRQAEERGHFLLGYASSGGSSTESQEGGPETTTAQNVIQEG